MSLFSGVRELTADEQQVAELIKRRRLQMLVHSCIYYYLNSNLIEDHVFDSWARELRQLQADYPSISRKVEHAEAFKDWDASTGAFLPIREPWVISKAVHLLNITFNETGRVDNIEHTKVQQSTGKTSSKISQRKSSTKQRGNALF